MNLWLIFLTGLTVGGFSCLAVQGGLLTSTIASRENENLEKKKSKHSNTLPVLSFLIAKLIAYVALGFLLGLFGQAIALSDGVRITMQLMAGVYMIAVALNLLNVHPIFRFVIIQPPRFAMRLIRNQSGSKDIFAPALLGIMTVFIPCGTTLAMEALAITSGPILGAVIMGVFTLATFPLFFSLGYMTAILGDTFRKNFLRLAAFIVIYLGVLSINGSLLAAGSPITLQSIGDAMPVQIDLSGGGPQENQNLTGNTQNGVQVVNINVTNSGYSPTYLRVKKGQPVKLNLTTSNAFSCATAFRIPSLGVVKDLKPTGTDSVEFTPVKSGKIRFTCSMGMYAGTLEVI
ncbi:MAG: putative membrane protein [Candidatus Daviesbacteria bacterium GW2011_GWA2_38_24]|uniref:Putative membrane protein n=1 Tax=Candidatus Daviesbacteria bacterium GW2011_GWA2_38_24 TaxID=1618422 RepID=A0A0G0MQY2_9BACT|nr:MAG: putative membrane protein [Candidatus Daviesbacteria bacterium GW2011_GWA2_38_24]KKQ80387.1 MAG: putative membrane protein [Candidatus Daviesbacteria bacterium GW2011_GWA1_38_7]OGE24715.1 MAG: hypothetical protein A2688_01760 [Candidatus Daviesbacteria bacterium RIFCSPHIGHO2_01_FULL_38_8]